MYKSGGILLNKKMDKVLLVIRKENEYSFPKGHLNKNENLIECAVREVTEESGRDVELLLQEPIGIIKYNHKIEGLIENYMYLFIDKGITKKIIKDEDKEKHEWIKLENVKEKLLYDDLKEFWIKIKPIIDKIKINNIERTKYKFYLNNKVVKFDIFK